MAVDGLTKMLLSNKFKEFVELVGVLKIEVSSDSEASDGESGDSEASDGESNNGKPSGNKNDGNLVANYYKEADEEVSFETEEAE